MLENLARIEERYEELNLLMADPKVATDHQRVAELAREQAGLERLVQAYRRYQEVSAQLGETRALLEEESDPEMLDLAHTEADSLLQEQEALWQELRLLLLPKDPNDEKNVIIEIRAGTGGDEAGLFAADLFRMYQRYAENRGWKTDLLSSHHTGIGGFKQVFLQVDGYGAYSRLKYESGVHRVQRVPATEAQGRIHTSTATVAVMPEMDEVEISISPNDIEIEAYISSGPGGQHMQKNATAVRIVHKRSGLVVTCESERSQTQNRLRAMTVLRSRLYDLEQQEQLAEQEEARRLQVGTGVRSEKIRTYNFPQNRVTDHRLNRSLYRLEAVLNGDLDEFIDELATTEQAERLQGLGEG
jgi:peptide chain release factor 1